MQAFSLPPFLLFFLLLISHSQCSEQVLFNTSDVRVRTEYVNETVLKHVVYLDSEGLSNNNICLFSDEIKLSIAYFGENQRKIEPLEQLNSECSTSNPSILTIYTKNPLNLSDIWTEDSLSLFPTYQTVLEAIKSNQPQVQLQILHNSIQSRFQDLKMVGDTIVTFNLTDPSFPASYLKQSSFQQWYFIVPAYLMVAFLVVNYFIRSFYTDKSRHSDHGEIIVHYLALASPTFMVESLTAELMSFCYGFMLLSFPWMSETFGKFFGNQLDTTPFQIKIFFTDPCIGSTYALAIIVIVAIAVFGYVIISLKAKSNEMKQENTSIFSNFLYNVFIYGALFSVMLSIQGIVYNSSNGVFSFKNPASSVFYIFGIVLLLLIVIDVIHSLFKYQSKHFYKIRSIVKIVFLSLSHLRVNYFIVVMIFLHMLFAGAEYLISKKENPKSFNKLWVFKNIILNLSLLLLIFMPIKLIAVIISFVFVGISIMAQIYEHYKIYESNRMNQTDKSYKAAHQNTINHTNHTDRYSKRINESIQCLEDPYSQFHILPNTIAAGKLNRPVVGSKQNSERINRQINLHPLKQSIEYEPRHRRERRKNSLKNSGLVSIPNNKVIINSSNEHILHVRSHIEKYDQSHY